MAIFDLLQKVSVGAGGRGFCTGTTGTNGTGTEE